MLTFKPKKKIKDEIGISLILKVEKLNWHNYMLYGQIEFYDEFQKSFLRFGETAFYSKLLEKWHSPTLKFEGNQYISSC